jgi:hypothetical protein
MRAAVHVHVHDGGVSCPRLACESTDSRTAPGYPPQVPFTQNSEPEGQSITVPHWTHAAFEQIGVEPAQSLSERHATQAPSGSQSLPVWEAQSPFTAHATQPAVVVLQTGVGAAHCVFDVQPATQTKRVGSQTGFATPQSALLRHCTQVLLAG